MLATIRRRWLEKATLTSADFTGGSNGGYLSPDQTAKFIRVATDEGAMLGRGRLETSKAVKFQVPRVSMHGVRVLQVGVEATRLADANRKKPVTGQVELNTILFKGEILVSEETFEDQIEQGAFADTIATQVAEAVGRDIEELALKNDTARIAGDNDPTAAENTLWDQFDGLVKQAQGLPSGQKYDGTGVTDPESILKGLLEKLPVRYRQRPAELALYVPVPVADAYVDTLTSRGTTLGDAVLQDGSLRPFRGVPVIPVPLLSGTGLINSVAINYGQFGFCTYRGNVLTGYHRRVRFRRWDDEREGSTSFLVSCRFDCKFAEPEAVAFGHTFDQW